MTIKHPHRRGYTKGQTIPLAYNCFGQDHRIHPHPFRPIEGLPGHALNLETQELQRLGKTAPPIGGTVGWQRWWSISGREYTFDQLHEISRSQETWRPLARTGTGRHYYCSRYGVSNCGRAYDTVTKKILPMRIIRRDDDPRLHWRFQCRLGATWIDTEYLIYLAWHGLPEHIGYVGWESDPAPFHYKALRWIPYVGNNGLLLTAGQAILDRTKALYAAGEQRLRLMTRLVKIVGRPAPENTAKIIQNAVIAVRRTEGSNRQTARPAKWPGIASDEFPALL